MSVDEWVKLNRHSYRHPDGHEVTREGSLWRAAHRSPDGRTYVARFSMLLDAQQWAETGELT